ncbi:ubiquitin carboxyl-terminal hydrolase (macronuclear) [Tetrahymena thermophila SB210]|uniref:Ubiquitin carboxyl-terminal hydrolase n=1 Tax=Tetrahymena thermophila (strain SB210) TaxID=312017 RepID=Q245Z0_TETTS|nr:ubiquitin carboxyl-terminal hydrolase [Tetrahymena thermophila SB210]EAS03493.3 ubiquitin carboxyl-terminal hydrolase [Tetrahymena thermophila SB210]|eukprot:XP_001023738.3 ubiquitin carboxyl-terminal hydrolase [Tetrahymena thermophila SB210]
MAEEQGDNWFPLESNPDVINPYVQGLGFDTAQYSWCDLLSVEEWAQEMVPKPCLAVVFLYPISENTTKYDQEEENQEQQVHQSVYFMRQYARNACGTVAVMHAMLNIDPSLVSANSVVDRFRQATREMTPEQRGNYFLTCNDLKQNHQQAVQQGQCSIQEEVDTHFIAFIQKEGHIYELDGRKKTPINHGQSSPDTFLQDACVVAKKLMDRDPSQLNFTLVALAKTQNEQEQ